jgi:hypothetical protein
MDVTLSRMAPPQTVEIGHSRHVERAPALSVLQIDGVGGVRKVKGFGMAPHR